jgi:polysaccharide export outer membrane protein
VYARILLFCVFSFVGCGSAIAQDYVIGGGDLLRVSVWDVPQLSVEVIVRPDGKITLPAVGDVIAAGATPKELALTIKSEIGKMVQEPVVTLTVVEVTNNRIYVAGGGVPSEVVPVSNQVTLFQFLCRFNSFSEADLKRAYLLRAGKKVFSNFEPLFFDGDMSLDQQLEANDIVFIPNYSDNKVYVVGAVNEPRYVTYRSGLKVLDAILEAGGFSEYADKGDVLIIRNQTLAHGEVKKTQFEADIKALLKGKDLKQNFLLQPGDYVNVKEGIF